MPLFGALGRFAQRVTAGAARPVPGKPINVQIPQADLNKIQTPDIGRKLVTRYGLREKAPVPTIATEVVPVILVDDLIGESDLIRPRIRPAAGFIRAVGAAQVVSCTLQNPASSNTIIHLYYFIVSMSATPTDVRWRSHAVAPLSDTPAQKGFRNTLFSNEGPVGIIHANVPATDFGGAQFGGMRGTTQNPMIIPWDHVIAANAMVSVETAANFTGNLDVTFVWSEEPTER